MKKITKIIILALVIILSFGLSACDVNNNNNGNGQNNNNTLLPDKDDLLKQAGDEVIFISFDQAGQITSMKASNHLRNTEFSYYEEEGVFFNSGHTNITSGKGPILIEGNKALIPSLDEHRNFFYTLALDHNYYEDLLPFKMDIKYFLNGYTVGYQSLKNATGRIKIEIDVKSNPNTLDYFQNNFAAQIQIPINLNFAHIVSSEGAMANVVTGTTSTLAYMVLPKTSTKIKLELDAYNFKFEGIQAVYQAFNLSNFTSSFIDFDELGLGKFTELSSGVNRIISEFNSADLQLSPLFDGIESIMQITENDDFAQLQVLVDNITGSMFRLGYRQAQISIKLTLEDAEEYRNKYIALGDGLEATINNIAISYTNFKAAIDDLLPKVKEVESYPNKYKTFNTIITKLEEIKLEISKIEDLGELDIEVLASNKDIVGETFKNLGLLNREIQSLFQDLIIEMNSLPLHLEGLASSVASIDTIIDNILMFAQYIAVFKEQLIEFCEEVHIDKEAKVFSATLDILGILDKFVKGVEVGDANNPSLLSALDQILEGFQSFDFDSGLDVSQLSRLYDINPQTKIRQIDELVLGFVRMNQALSITQDGEDMSFYEGLTNIASASQLISLIPINSQEVSNIISFLSENNLEPISIQFVIKQQGF